MIKKIKNVSILSIAASSLFLAACSSDSVSNLSPSSVPIADEPSSQETDSTKDPVTASLAKESDEATNSNVGTINTDKIDSKCIAENIIGQSPTRQFFVYLPPSYEYTDKKYPVVYFLHGYGDIAKDFISYTQLNLDKAFEAGSKEFIMVVLDGNNVSGGSFYENSPVIGNWEDFITQEVVSYIDTTYRTLAKPDSRCISGYSMGGYGALNIALKHPDIFSDVIVFCPGIYADGDISSMLNSWRTMPSVKISYGQVFSPNDDPSKHYANIPEETGTTEDNKIMDDWDKGYGDWKRKINDYLALNTPLKGIQINYGAIDQFTWIPNGCKFFSSVLSTNNVEHELNELDGGHGVPVDAIENYYVPFLEEHLKYE